MCIFMILRKEENVMLFVLNSNEFRQLSKSAQREIITILNRKKPAEIEAMHLKKCENPNKAVSLNKRYRWKI